MTYNPVSIKGPLDPMGGVVTIDYAHHEVHEGHMFIASYKSPEGADVADNGTVILQITTGSRYDHFTFLVSSGGDTEVEVLEAPTSTGGTAIQSVAMNRNGMMTPASSVVHTPSISVAGILIEHYLLPGGVGANFSGGGMARKDTEWILKPRTKYAIRATNRAGSGQPMSMIFEWYEEE